jgi:NADH-quinone oxidoreductase subunit F
MGNCLCVLGDSMAMPVKSMMQYFRPEFEQHIEDARARWDHDAIAAPVGADLLAAGIGEGPV